MRSVICGLLVLAISFGCTQASVPVAVSAPDDTGVSGAAAVADTTGPAPASPAVTGRDIAIAGAIVAPILLLGFLSAVGAVLSPG